jgi:hypothetical protein
MSASLNKIAIETKEFHEKVKSNIYDEIIGRLDICRLVTDNFPADCILTAEKQDINAHKMILEAVSAHLKVKS